MKYLRKFKTLNEAQTEGASGLFSPHIDRIVEKRCVNHIVYSTEKFTCEFNEDGKVDNPQATTPNDEIWYTSTDGNIVNPNVTGSSIFGANMVSNTYSNGKGIGLTGTYPIYVPSESVDIYKVATNWSSYADRIQAIPS